MTVAFDLPATYRIQVKGRLDDSWSDRLGGMAIQVIDHEKSGPVTSLVGWLPDQAALCGVLDALYGMHLPLLSVELIRVDGEPEGE